MLRRGKRKFYLGNWIIVWFYVIIFSCCFLFLRGRCVKFFLKKGKVSFFGIELKLKVDGGSDNKY